MKQISGFFFFFLPISVIKKGNKPDFLNSIRVCVTKTMVINNFFRVFLAVSQDRCGTGNGLIRSIKDWNSSSWGAG